MALALVTGTAGFIGMHLAKRMLSEGWLVIGIDALTPGYDPAICHARLARLCSVKGYIHDRRAIESPGALNELMAEHRPDIVVHLAAKAGVRASIDNPRPYFETNLQGTFELLEAAKAHPPKHLLMASTSSAYGANAEMPFVETMKADWPVSFYAATKKATETLAHAHSHIHDLPTTVFRFFTVYGPWGRPDMAYYLFTDAIMNDRTINVFNHGDMRRDFVYVDDLVEAIMRLTKTPPVRPDRHDDIPEGDSLSPVAPFRVINIGKSAPDTLNDFIAQIEKATGRTAKKTLMDMQPGDVPATWADASLLLDLTGYLPSTPLSVGIPRFVEWYLGDAPRLPH